MGLLSGEFRRAVAFTQFLLLRCVLIQYKSARNALRLALVHTSSPEKTLFNPTICAKLMRQLDQAMVMLQFTTMRFLKLPICHRNTTCETECVPRERSELRFLLKEDFFVPKKES